MEHSHTIPVDSLFRGLCLDDSLLVVTNILVEPSPKAQCSRLSTNSPLPTSGSLRSRSRRDTSPPDLAVHGYVGEAHAV